MSLILSGSDGLSDVDGSASTPAIRGTDTNTGIFFPAADTIAFSEGGAEVARFDSSGRLGIGTSSPTAKLSVQSNGAGGNLELLQLRADAAATGGNTANLSIFAASDLITLATGTSDALAFVTGGSTERMRIDSSGSLLVGTTVSPQVSGASGLELYNAGSYGRINLGKTASGTVNGFAFYHNASLVGTVTYSNTATAYNTSSDYRLKENIAPMTGALARVQDLKPVTYNWKADGSEGQGFIAHELAEIVPDCVSGEKDAVDAEGKPQYQGIDTSFLVATLTAAIQEQQAIITELKSRIETLEAK